MPASHSFRTLAWLASLCAAGGAFAQAQTPHPAPALDVTGFFSEVDLDHDGCATREEWTRAGAPMSAYDSLKDAKGCVTLAHMQAVAPPPGIDLNGDGKLTLAEMKTFVEQRANAAASTACDRACLADMVARVVASMPAHDPDTLPLATTYAATENSHPAALGMMAAWRTITRAGKPALEAIDVSRGQAYFALPVSEGGGQSALWGRIKVADHRITEIEIYVNRSRGDHGFSFSAQQMPKNYGRWMSLPPTRKRASRDELEKLARASFDASDPYTVEIAADCQFSEVGSLVIDPGLDDQPLRPNAQAPLGCVFPPFRPTDLKARVIAVDDQTGTVVVAAVVRGVVYPYPFRGHVMSAFIPDDMKEPGQAQEDWIQRKKKAGQTGLLAPTPATAECMQVLQLYDGKLQGSQINVYLSGPQMHSAWVK